MSQTALVVVGPHDAGFNNPTTVVYHEIQEASGLSPLVTESLSITEHHL